jgi:hypothetical protein
MAAQLLPVLWQSARTTLRVLWRVTRQVFHEAMGTLFWAFALYCGIAAWRQWKYRPTIWLMAFAIAYTVVMAVFGFSSFRRARGVR